MSFHRVGAYGVNFGPTGPAAYAFTPALTPVAFDSKVVVTGHSVPDNVFQWPWSGVIEDKGFTLDIDSTTGPFATALGRWEGNFTGPDQVRPLMEAPGAAYDLFLGTEAHGGGYTGQGGGGNSVLAHIEFSQARETAVLWHNLAASVGCQTFYASFWRNDTSETFGSAWRADLDNEVGPWNTIIDYVNANKAGGTPDMRLVPWLDVFMAVYDGIQSGAVTGLSMADVFVDDVHVETAVGQWLQMATVMAVMYQRHPDELGDSWATAFSGPRGSISSTLAAQLRPIVWAACTANPRTGLVAV